MFSFLGKDGDGDGCTVCVDCRHCSAGVHQARQLGGRRKSRLGRPGAAILTPVKKIRQINIKNAKF